jgi:hypothetical protein
VNAQGSDATVTIGYGLSPTMATKLGTAAASPGVATGTGDTAITGTIASGLTPNSTYCYRTSATNGAGTTVGDIACFMTPPVTVPGPPHRVTALAGNRRATVSFEPPGFDGGSPITGYTVTAVPGGQTCTATPLDLLCTVDGLDNGKVYTFTVTATNGVGTGEASEASNDDRTQPNAGDEFEEGSRLAGNPHRDREAFAAFVPCLELTDLLVWACASAALFWCAGKARHSATAPCTCRPAGARRRSATAGVLYAGNCGVGISQPRNTSGRWRIGYSGCRRRRRDSPPTLALQVFPFSCCAAHIRGRPRWTVRPTRPSCYLQLPSLQTPSVQCGHS